ncbi:carboxypeptidase-like regulatory domain-containing protein [bacterium]|nr:carboxypeptidase-like regulatory domain-containing protein [bacterium]
MIRKKKRTSILRLLWNNKIFRIVLILGVIALSIFLLFKYINREIPAERITVEGRVYDLETDSPLKGVEVNSLIDGETDTKTDERGEFSLEVWDDDTLVLVGSDFFEEVRIPVKKRKSIDIGIESSVLEFSRQIEDAERFRKYRILYQYLEAEQKEEYTEDEYLAVKNSWRDSHTDEGLSGPIEVQVSREVDRDGEEYKTIVTYFWQRGDEIEKEIFEFVFIKQEGFTFRDATLQQ